jgi:hypothetical protein
MPKKIKEALRTFQSELVLHPQNQSNNITHMHVKLELTLIIIK